MAACALVAAEDLRHALQEGEHEAFYFLFSSPDGQLFGLLRTLFDRRTVLELLALRSQGRTWTYQQRTALPESLFPSPDASGPALTLLCRDPWQAWQSRFQGELQAVGEETRLPADLDLCFEASNEPALYPFGPYRQVQQDGRLTGQVQLGTQAWSGDLICYRDHSWGRRPMGAADGWTILSVPDRFYIVVAQLGEQMVSWGRFVGAMGEWLPVCAPRLVPTGEGLQVEDRVAGMEAWQLRRLAPPLVVHLGPAGQEAVREDRRPGDLYHDEIGPALFTSPRGETFVGFWDRSRRLS